MRCNELASSFSIDEAEDLYMRDGRLFEPKKRKPKLNDRKLVNYFHQKGPESNKRGKRTESRFSRLMRDSIPSRPWFVSCVKASTHQDIFGHFDFMLTFQDVKTERTVTCGVQVKSSKYWAGLFKKEHSDIPVIVAGEQYSDKYVLNQVEKLFKSTIH